MPMSKKLKIIFYSVSGLLGLLILVVLVLLYFVDANAYKGRFEEVASGALGMEVKVGGQMGIRLFPGLLITLADVHISNQGAEIASAKEAKLAMVILPLLQKKARFAKITLKQPRISIERDHDGRFNFEKPGVAAETLPALNLARVSISDGTFLYEDKQFEQGFEAGECSLDLRRLRLSAGKNADLIKNLSFKAELACGKVQKKDFTVSDLKFTAVAKSGIFDFKPITMRVFGGQGSGSLQADFARDVPDYRVQYSLSQFSIEELFKTRPQEFVAKGPMDFSANLGMQGKTLNEMTQTANGEASLQGKNITLDGIDLDKVLSRFESSQKFNLVDVGAFIFAGPYGMVVTKGYNFARIFQGSEGSSAIQTIVSGWKIVNGVAQAQDVAMATNQHRMALHGGLDFVNKQFNDVTVAMVNTQGCAMVKQKISGTFQNPVVEKQSILKSLSGPAVKLLKQGRRLLPGGECDVFYAGSVAPPV